VWSPSCSPRSRFSRPSSPPSGLPHTHSGPNPGFFNQDHDLSSLAGLTASGPLPAAPAFGPALVVRTLIAPLPPRLVWRPAGGSSSRAPLVSA
jgi:hypothetical protein